MNLCYFRYKQKTDMALALSMAHWSSQPLLHHQVRNFRIFYYNYIVCNNFMTFTRPTLTSHSTQCFETLLMKLNVRYATFSTRRSTLVGQHPMKSLSSVYLSVCPSVTKFSQDWIKCWSQTFEKKNSNPKLGFVLFSQVWFSSFPGNPTQW